MKTLHKLLIYSDTSGNARGADFRGTITGKNWSLEERSYHIKVKEMLAFFCPNLFCKAVLKLNS